MKEQILQLREQGKTYTEIQQLLGCSRGTISYHCGEGQKEKTVLRQRKSRRGERSIIYRKIDLFLNRNKNNNLAYINRSEINDLMYNKIISNPYCYITGDKINLSDSTSYQLDHIIPYHISQDNSIDNLGLTTRDANASKAHMTIEQYITLCEKVIKHNKHG